MEKLQAQNFINRSGVLIMITSAGQILAKAVLSSKSEFVVSLDPKEYSLEDLRGLTIHQVIKAGK